MQLDDRRPNDLGDQHLFEVEMMTGQQVAATAPDLTQREPTGVL
jgi:hypothetical protein